MQLRIKEEYGPQYIENINEKKESFVEPTYFELKDDLLHYIMDKNDTYFLIGQTLQKSNKKNIGIPLIKSIIMDANGNAYDYEEIEYAKWKDSIEIKVDGQVYEYKYNPIVEPETIQLISTEKALVTLRKRHLVVLIDKSGQVLWQFGEDMCPGTGNKLMVPIFSIMIYETGNILICDALNSRVIEVNRQGKIIWQYGKERMLGSVKNMLWKPTCARRMKNGNTAIADSKNNRIIFVNQEKCIVDSVGQATIRRQFLNYPRSVQVLPNGNWLIANTHMNNIIEVDSKNMEIIRTISDLNLYWPRCACYDEKCSEIIIGDGLNNRIIFLDYSSLEIKNIMSEYSINGKKHIIGDPHQISVNNENHNLLITLSEVNEVIEITHGGKVVKKWDELNDPHSAKYFNAGIIISNSGDSSIDIHYFNGKVDRIKSFYVNKLEKETFNRPRFSIPYKGGILVLDTANQRIIYLEQLDQQWYGQIINIDYPYFNSRKTLDNARWIDVSDNEIFITDTENCRIMCMEMV